MQIFGPILRSRQNHAQPARILTVCLPISSTCKTLTFVTDDPDASSTEVDRGDLGTFNISYVSAMTPLLGYYVSDLFSVGDISVEQVIGVATSANPNDPPGGIFGIGLSAAESQAERGGLEYSGFIDTLAAAGLIETRAYSIYLDDISVFIAVSCCIEDC